jgi:hypothetical protein
LKYQGIKKAIAAWINDVTIHVKKMVQLNNVGPRVKLYINGYRINVECSKSRSNTAPTMIGSAVNTMLCNWYALFVIIVIVNIQWPCLSDGYELNG